MKCLVCNKEFTHHPYGDNKCPNCKQAYEYEEGQMIKLTKRQLKILREDKKGNG